MGWAQPSQQLSCNMQAKAGSGSRLLETVMESPHFHGFLLQQSSGDLVTNPEITDGNMDLSPPSSVQLTPPPWHLDPSLLSPPTRPSLARGPRATTSPCSSLGFSLDSNLEISPSFSQPLLLLPTKPSALPSALLNSGVREERPLKVAQQTLEKDDGKQESEIGKVFRQQVQITAAPKQKAGGKKYPDGAAKVDLNSREWQENLIKFDAQKKIKQDAREEVQKLRDEAKQERARKRQHEDEVKSRRQAERKAMAQEKANHEAEQKALKEKKKIEDAERKEKKRIEDTEIKRKKKEVMDSKKKINVSERKKAEMESKKTSTSQVQVKEAPGTALAGSEVEEQTRPGGLSPVVAFRREGGEVRTKETALGLPVHLVEMVRNYFKI